MTKNIKNFVGGVKLVDNKKSTKDISISNMPAPDNVYIPLIQHIGKQSIPVVKVGEHVAMGQLVARAIDENNSNIFSSVSGTVIAINAKRPGTQGLANHIEISSDGLDTPFVLPKLENPTTEDVIKRIFDAGIVGLGGAGFPTHRKVKVDKTVDELIINGIECEPYITCDYRLMVDYTQACLKGVKHIADCTQAKKVIIAIKAKYPALATQLEQAIKGNYDNFGVQVFDDIYPQGAEKQLVYAATGKIAPTPGYPLGVGVVVSNIATAYAVYQAVDEGKTHYQRAVTVTGQAIKQPTNLWIRIGTQLEDILKFVGLSEQALTRLVLGGPMMGFEVSSLQVATTKTVNCVLALTDEEAPFEVTSQCINCAACARNCPMKLMPMFITQFGIVGDAQNSAKYGAKSCIECGCCNFVCPAKIPLVSQIRDAKKMIAIQERRDKKTL